MEADATMLSEMRFCHPSFMSLNHVVKKNGRSEVSRSLRLGGDGVYA